MVHSARTVVVWLHKQTF